MIPLLARGKIRRENGAVFITQTNLQQSRQANLQLTISSKQGKQARWPCTIDCKETALPAQVEILVMYCFNRSYFVSRIMRKVYAASTARFSENFNCHVVNVKHTMGLLEEIFAKQIHIEIKEVLTLLLSSYAIKIYS